MTLLKFILILFLFNFQSWGEIICTQQGKTTYCWESTDGRGLIGGETKPSTQLSPSQPLKLVQEIRTSLGAAWYCNKEDWETILQDIREGYTIPEIRVSRLIVDKSDKVLEYKYFVVMKKLGEKGILVSNSRRQTYGVIHYHDSPRLE